LRRENFDIFAEAHEGRPSGADVAAKAEGFVLSEDKYAMKIGINAIGESDVNNAVESAEGYGGLSAVAGEGPETFALTASEKDSDGIAHHGHEDDPQRRNGSASVYQQSQGFRTGKSEANGYYRRVSDGLGANGSGF